MALIGSGQSSTITGTLAGQIVMEGYLDLRIRPWLRRLITRMIAIVPAVICILAFGEDVLGDLLVLSQVILSLQLGFAVIPLIHFNSDRARMKEHTIPTWTMVLAWCTAVVIVLLNARLVVQEIAGWMTGEGDHVIWVQLLVVPIALLAGFLLLYVTFAPILRRALTDDDHAPHGNAVELDIPATRPGPVTTPSSHPIAITVDFSKMDGRAIQEAVRIGGTESSYHILHVNESAVARYLGKWGVDRETHTDERNVNEYVRQLTERGYVAVGHLGNGHATKVIPELVAECGAEMLVMGAHGHRGIKDILLGATVDAVRHRVNVPVLVVR